MTTRVVRVLACGTLAALAVLAACEGQRTTENAPFGQPSYNFRLVGLSRGLPGSAGSDAVFLSLAAFDTSLADAYGRRGDLSVRLRTAALPLTNPTSGGATFSANTPGWNLVTTLRDLARDGRAPLMTSVADTITEFALEGPEAAGGMWRFSIDLRRLVPSTGYTVALFRYGLAQRDSLDQVAVLNTGSNFTAPDTLKVLGGTGASPAIAGGCAVATAAVASATANPLILGTVTTGTTGRTGRLQVCIQDLAGLYYRGTNVDLQKTPFAHNGGVTDTLPHYNYLVVYNTGTGVPILRAQLGQDLAFGTGAPINNAFAPMPCRATAPNACPASNVLTTSQKIAAAGSTANVDSVRVSLRGLKALGGSGVYQAWLVNPATGAAPVPALGRLVVSQLDTVTDVPVLVTNRTVLDSTTTDVSSFVGYPMPQASHVTWQFRPTSAASGVSLRDYTHVLITLETGGPATTPSSNTALWLQFGDQKGTADLKDDTYFDGSAGPAPAVAWGRLDLVNNLTTRVFTAAGTGLGGVRGDELSVDLNAMARPPVGYYYQAWLQDVNGPDGSGTDTVYVAVDTLRAPYPGRALLVDADNSLPDPVVQDVPPEISAASFRNFAASMGLDPVRLCNDTIPERGACPFGAFENFIVTLEPKGSNAASPSPTLVFAASLPTIVKTGR